MAKQDFNANKAQGFSNYAEVFKATSEIIADMTGQQASLQASAQGIDSDEAASALIDAQKKLLTGTTAALETVIAKIGASSKLTVEVRSAFTAMLENTQRAFAATAKLVDFIAKVEMDDIELRDMDDAALERKLESLLGRVQLTQLDSQDVRRATLEAVYGFSAGKKNSGEINSDMTLHQFDREMAAVEYDANLHKIMPEAMVAMQQDDMSAVQNVIRVMDDCQSRARTLKQAAAASTDGNLSACMNLPAFSEKMYEIVKSGLQGLVDGDYAAAAAMNAALPQVANTILSSQPTFYALLSQQLENEKPAPAAKANPRGPKA